MMLILIKRSDKKKFTKKDRDKSVNGTFNYFGYQEVSVGGAKKYYGTLSTRTREINHPLFVTIHEYLKNWYNKKVRDIMYDPVRRTICAIMILMCDLSENKLTDTRKMVQFIL